MSEMTLAKKYCGCEKNQALVLLLSNGIISILLCYQTGSTKILKPTLPTLDI